MSFAVATTHEKLVEAVAQALHDMALEDECTGINICRGRAKGCWRSAEGSDCADCYRVERGDLRTAGEIVKAMARGNG